jgi:hypothetical protein
MFSRCGYCRPFGFKGVSRAKCLKVPTNLKRPLIAKIAIAGRQNACTFDTLIFCLSLKANQPQKDATENSTFKNGSGRSSNDGSGFV